MGVVSIVITSLHHLYIIFSNLWLLCKFITQEVGNQVKVAVEQPAHDAEGKHVTALQYRLVVHTALCKTVLDHLCQRALYDAVRVDAHLSEVVLALELCLL